MSEPRRFKIVTYFFFLKKKKTKTYMGWVNP